MEVQTGDLLAGKYRVERVLGRGGMGVVVAAVQQPVGRRVAVKVLLRKDDDARAVARFTREARAAAELGSAHVVHLFDFGTLDSGAPYLAMELLDGVDLRSALERDGPLAIETAAQIALDVCEALARAHARGIVHRDIKPANLFLVRDHGRASIKVLDFGVAKTNELGDEGAALTQSDALLGTPRYMAPEQILSASDADARSDVWSLGATLYELVSGVPAFADATVGKTVARVLKARPAPLPPSVPAPFAAVIARCLSRAPKDRYPDVGALATALAPFAPANMSERPATIARILGPSARGEVTQSTETFAPSIDVTRNDSVTRARPRRNMALFSSLAAFGVAMAMVVAVRRGAPVAAPAARSPAPESPGATGSVATVASASAPVASVTAVSSFASAPVAPRAIAKSAASSPSTSSSAKGAPTPAATPAPDPLEDP